MPDSPDPSLTAADPSPARLPVMQLPGYLLRLWKTRGFSAVMAEFVRKDTHPFLQFVKYGISGVGALAVHVVVFALLLRFAWPELNDTSMNRWDRALATTTPTMIAFIFSNALAYWLNTKWVFTQGRHAPLKEFLLFTLVNLPGAAGGFIGQAALIHFLNWPPLLAMIGFVIPNVMINFVCRKFFIFKG